MSVLVDRPNTAAREAREATAVALIRALVVALSRAGHRHAGPTRRLAQAADALTGRPGWSEMTRVLDRIGDVLADLDALEPTPLGAARHARALRDVVAECWTARLAGEKEV